MNPHFINELQINIGDVYTTVCVQKCRSSDKMKCNQHNIRIAVVKSKWHCQHIQSIDRIQ